MPNEDGLDDTVSMAIGGLPGREGDPDGGGDDGSGCGCGCVIAFFVALVVIAYVSPFFIGS